MKRAAPTGAAIVTLSLSKGLIIGRIWGDPTLGLRQMRSIDLAQDDMVPRSQRFLCMVIGGRPPILRAAVKMLTRFHL